MIRTWIGRHGLNTVGPHNEALDIPNLAEFSLCDIIRGPIRAGIAYIIE